MARWEQCGFIWLARQEDPSTKKTEHVKQICNLENGHEGPHESASGVTVRNKER